MQNRRVHLDILDIPNPCTEDWSRMSGDERSRFCGTCKNHVYNLSAMTREEAEALLSHSDGRVCVRFYRRADGTVVTADCTPERFAAARRRARRALVFAAAMVTTTIGTVLGLRIAFDPDAVLVMGSPAPPPNSWEIDESPVVEKN